MLSTVGTAIYTVYSRCNYLHCLLQVQLSTLSIVGTTIYIVNSRYKYLHCPQQIQLSTLCTIGTTIHTVYSGCSCLHCQQQVQLSTLSTIGKTIYTQSTIVKTIYTVYNRYSYLHCLQHVSQLYLLQKVLLKFAEKVHPAKFSKIRGRLSHPNEIQQIPHINYSIVKGYIRTKILPTLTPRLSPFLSQLQRGECKGIQRIRILGYGIHTSFTEITEHFTLAYKYPG